MIGPLLCFIVSGASLCAPSLGAAADRIERDASLTVVFKTPASDAPPWDWLRVYPPRTGAAIGSLVRNGHVIAVVFARTSISQPRMVRRLSAGFVEVASDDDTCWLVGDLGASPWPDADVAGICLAVAGVARRERIEQTPPGAP